MMDKQIRPAGLTERTIERVARLRGGVVVVPDLLLALGYLELLDGRLLVSYTRRRCMGRVRFV